MTIKELYEKCQAIVEEEQNASEDKEFLTENVIRKLTQVILDNPNYETAYDAAKDVWAKWDDEHRAKPAETQSTLPGLLDSIITSGPGKRVQLKYSTFTHWEKWEHIETNTFATRLAHHEATMELIRKHKPLFSDEYPTAEEVSKALQQGLLKFI